MQGFEQFVTAESPEFPQLRMTGSILLVMLRFDNKWSNGGDARAEMSVRVSNGWGGFGLEKEPIYKFENCTRTRIGTAAKDDYGFWVRAGQQYGEIGYFDVSTTISFFTQIAVLTGVAQFVAHTYLSRISRSKKNFQEASRDVEEGRTMCCGKENHSNSEDGSASEVGEKEANARLRRTDAAKRPQRRQNDRDADKRRARRQGRDVDSERSSRSVRQVHRSRAGEERRYRNNWQDNRLASSTPEAPLDRKKGARGNVLERANSHHRSKSSESRRRRSSTSARKSLKTDATDGLDLSVQVLPSELEGSASDSSSWNFEPHSRSSRL
mmetsp:Transcript_9046/g.17311  ORF Transcript_9046/g.17311 Transcript_9046/m.17311 type:complete len:325 (+) Transcript_9046:378-1352(+)